MASWQPGRHGRGNATHGAPSNAHRRQPAGNSRARPHLRTVNSRFAPDRILVILAVLHAYIGVRLLAPFGFAVQSAGALVLLASFALVPKGFRLPRGLGPRRLLLRWLSMGFFSWLLVLTLARDACLLASGLAVAPAAHEAWVRISAAAVMLATPAITAIGFF